MLLDLLFWFCGFNQDTKLSITWALRCFCSEVSCPLFPPIFHTFDFQYLVWRFYIYKKPMTSTYRFRTSKNMIFGELLRWTSSIPRCQQKKTRFACEELLFCVGRLITWSGRRRRAKSRKNPKKTSPKQRPERIGVADAAWNSGC